VDLFNILLTIIFLFVFFIILKSFMNKWFKENFCVICISIFLSWFFLLILYWYGIFVDKTLIGILMGGSIVGIYYFTENKISYNFKIFRLPFLLSMILVSYTLLNGFFYSFYKSILLILVLWIIGGLILLYKKNDKMNSLINKLVECCKSW